MNDSKTDKSPMNNEKPVLNGLVLAGGRSIVRALQSAGYYSDAISERHGGSLRSPEFVIGNLRRYVWIPDNGNDGRPSLS